MNYSLSNSIRVCERLTALSRSNFAPAFAMLPRGKRQAMHILYAYTRFTDDLIDLPDFDPNTGQEIAASNRRKKQKLNQWTAVLETVLGKIGGNSGVDNPDNEKRFQEIAVQFPNCGGLVLLPALKMIIDRYNIPKEAVFQLLDGVEHDIDFKPFETFDDCADYCHQVATSVGFASLSIWGTHKPLFSDNVLKAAKACGVAFQWTNILRDLYEDHNAGRVYLPQNEIRRFGLTLNQFGLLVRRKEWDEQKKPPKGMSEQEAYSFRDHVQNMERFEESFLKLIHHELSRCEVYYENSRPLYKFIHSDSRRMFGMMWNRYYGLFKKMRRDPRIITSGRRVSLSGYRKFRLWLHWRFALCRQL